MDTFITIISYITAIMFLMAGMMKLFIPKKQLAKMMAWSKDYSKNMLIIIGLLELSAAIALVVPPIIERFEYLVPAAAVGLILLMMGAMRVHIKRKETMMIMLNMMLMILAIIIVLGRVF